MKIAVLLLSCAGSNRRTNLTKSWFEVALGRVRAYFLAQSGQRVTFDFTVFDWTELSITSDEWIALGASVGATAKVEVGQAKDVDLSGFDWFILIIDDQVSTSGATDQDTRIAAISATPAIITHELGHMLGATHTYLKKPEGFVEYGGPFCTMGGEGDKRTFSDPQVSAVLAGEPGTHAASGPGMCIPNLLNAGWLDAAQHIRKIVVSSDGSISSSERLVALDGAPPAGANVVCGLEIELGDRFICEYRSPRVFWDQAVGAPDGTGWLVIYRSPPDGTVVPRQVAAIPAHAGQSVVVGDTELHHFGGAPLRLSVLSVDPGGSAITVRADRRKGKPPQYERTDGILDFQWWATILQAERIPVDEDVLEVLQELGRFQTVRELERVGGERFAPHLRSAAARTADDLLAAVHRLGRSLTADG